IGINPADYGRIFERFVQVDGSSSREFSGTGLGLSLARELVELHGGQIYVKSELGQGTRFWFDLPLTAAIDVEPRPLAQSQAPEGRESGPEQPPVASPSRRTRFADLDACRLEDPTSDASPTDADGLSRATVLVVDDTAE